MTNNTAITDKTVICYIDANTNAQNYDVTSVNIKDWQKAHPAHEIVFAFKEKWNMCDIVTQREQDFILNCHRYNMTAADLHRKFINNKNHVIEITGYKSANTTYKFIIFDHTDMKEYKVTPNYMKAQTEFWKGI